jgi:hypothetical protein
MPMWRCPHCGTPQPEAARCWVCRRSSTTCSTCRHFRESLAASVGFCGLDRRRAPLSGSEHRGCWAAARPSLAAAARPVEATAAAGLATSAADRLRPGRLAPRPGILEGFVPVELAADGPRELHPLDAPPAPPAAAIETVEGWAERETLFGDREI